MKRNQAFMFYAVAAILPLMILVSLPLALNLVTPGGHYGLNVPGAFGPVEAWYDLNAFLCRAAIGSSILLFLLHLWVGRKVREDLYVVYLLVMVSSSVFAPIVMTVVFIATRT